MHLLDLRVNNISPCLEFVRPRTIASDCILQVTSILTHGLYSWGGGIYKVMKKLRETDNLLKLHIDMHVPGHVYTLSVRAIAHCIGMLEVGPQWCNRFITNGLSGS